MKIFCISFIKFLYFYLSVFSSSVFAQPLSPTPTVACQLNPLVNDYSKLTLAQQSCATVVGNDVVYDLSKITTAGSCLEAIQSMSCASTPYPRFQYYKGSDSLFNVCAQKVGSGQIFDYQSLITAQSGSACNNMFADLGSLLSQVDQILTLSYNYWKPSGQKVIKFASSGNVMVPAGASQQGVSAHVILLSSKNLLIDGGNTMFRFLSRSIHGFYFKEASHVTIQNMLLDYFGSDDSLPYRVYQVTQKPSRTFISSGIANGVAFSTYQVSVATNLVLPYHPETLSNFSTKNADNDADSEILAHVVRIPVNPSPSATPGLPQIIATGLSPNLEADRDSFTPVDASLPATASSTSVNVKKTMTFMYNVSVKPLQSTLPNRFATEIANGDFIVVTERHDGVAALKFENIRPYGLTTGDQNQAKNIFILSSPGPGFQATSQKGFVVDHLVVAPPSGVYHYMDNYKQYARWPALISANADGINAGEGELVTSGLYSYTVKNSLVANAGDDGISFATSNIGEVLTNFYNAENPSCAIPISGASLPKQSGSSVSFVFLTNSEYPLNLPTIAPGIALNQGIGFQRIGFSSGLGEMGAATISATPTPSSAPGECPGVVQLTVQFDVISQAVNFYNSIKAPAAVSDAVNQTNRMYVIKGKLDRMPNVLIQKNSVFDGFSRGIFFAGVYSPVIDSNLITRTVGPGILGQKEFRPGSWILPNVTSVSITNNVLSNIFSIGNYGQNGEKVGAIQIDNVNAGASTAQSSPNSISLISGNNIDYKQGYLLSLPIDDANSISVISESRSNYGFRDGGRWTSAQPAETTNVHDNYCDVLNLATASVGGSLAPLCAQENNVLDYLLK